METFDGVKVRTFVNSYLHFALVPHPLCLGGDVVTIDVRKNIVVRSPLELGTLRGQNLRQL